MLNIYTERLDNLVLKEPRQEKEKTMRVLVYVNCLWLRESEPQVVEDPGECPEKLHCAVKLSVLR